ncbi:hypothetical protein [Skermanella aerolata]|uniref:hypothetical protein n=1 Tax=Skermanella aerolata TaxID=393310 RepID=UPI0011BD9395|nr:hypothetical protein [Skermanella aerolata]
MDRQTIVVAVHGVGEASPGDILADLLRQARLTGVFDHLLVCGVSYPRAQATGKILYEIPWADLRPVVTGGLSLIIEVVALFTAMLQAATVEPSASVTKPNFQIARTYKAVLLAAGIWCLFPPVMLLLLQFQPGRLQQVFIASSVVIFIVILTFWLKKFDRCFLGGFVWALGTACLAVWALASESTDGVPLVIAARIYAVAQFVVLGLALAAIAESTWQWRKERSRRPAGDKPTALHLMTRWAFIYVPLMLASGVGALGWALALQHVPASTQQSVPDPTQQKFSSWAEAFNEGLLYDLWNAEVLFTAAVTFYGLALLAVGVVYLVRSKRYRPSAGSNSRDGLAAVLFLMPFILTATTVLFLTDIAWDWLGGCLHRPEPGERIIQIYQISALRLVPFLAFLVGPLAIGLKVAGDVIFYLCPQGSPLAIREKARERVLQLLKVLPPNADIHLIGHSQGSVIGLEAATASGRHMKVHIMGSPIDSLYQRFIGLNLLGDGELLRRIILDNSYRRDDYIGGEVGEHFAVPNFPVEFGGHTGYWRFFDIAKWQVIPKPINSDLVPPDRTRC